MNVILLDNFIFGSIKVLPLIVVSYGAILTTKFIFAIIRKHTINEGFWVTGVLIPLIIPIDVPLWRLAFATILCCYCR